MAVGVAEEGERAEHDDGGRRRAGPGGVSARGIRDAMVWKCDILLRRHVAVRHDVDII